MPKNDDFGMPSRWSKKSKRSAQVSFQDVFAVTIHYFRQAGSPGRHPFRAREAQGKDTRKEEGSNTPEARGPANYIFDIIYHTYILFKLHVRGTF